MEIAEIAAAGLQQVDLERQKLQFLFDAGMIDRAQVLQAEEQFEQQRYQIQLQALQAKQQLLDPDKNPVEAARVKEEMLQLERQYQLRLSEIKHQAALENNRYQLQAVQGIEQGLTSVFSKIGTQIRTVGQLVRSVFQTVGQVVIGILAQIAAKWIAQQIIMRLFGKGAAEASISEEAAKAGAGGVASMAAAPFPLNLSAPEFGAAMAGVAAGFGVMASAAGGFDIPAGLNPITQLHEREMVLPSAQADVIRDLAGHGGARGGALQVTIHAVDGASVRRLLMDNPDALADAFKNAGRRGHL